MTERSLNTHHVQFRQLLANWWLILVPVLIWWPKLSLFSVSVFFLLFIFNLKDLLKIYCSNSLFYILTWCICISKCGGYDFFNFHHMEINIVSLHHPMLNRLDFYWRSWTHQLHTIMLMRWQLGRMWSSQMMWVFKSSSSIFRGWLCNLESRKGLRFIRYYGFLLQGELPVLYPPIPFGFFFFFFNLSFHRF